jgi:hypothetical protein
VFPLFRAPTVNGSADLRPALAPLACSEHRAAGRPSRPAIGGSGGRWSSWQ